MSLVLFFFNDTATTEIYTLSLHDALPISPVRIRSASASRAASSSRTCSVLLPTELLSSRLVPSAMSFPWSMTARRSARSEEHTSELQSRQYLVCRLLLEKKKTNHLVNIA